VSVGIDFTTDLRPAVSVVFMGITTDLRPAVPVVRVEMRPAVSTSALKAGDCVGEGCEGCWD